MRDINMDMIRVTEAAAISASAWVGSGNKELADKAATDAMRDRLNRLPIAGKIVIGEGLKDASYGLFRGEYVGQYGGYRRGDDSPGFQGAIPSSGFDICVDPIEGTRPTVTAGPEAISVIGLAAPGGLVGIDDFYAMKLAYGPRLRDKGLSLKLPVEGIISTAAYALGKPRDRVVACVLDRPRHSDIIRELRGLGVRIKLIQDCDVSGAVAPCLPDSGVDLLLGIGGAPEAVIAACAIKCLGGGMQVMPVDMDKDGKHYALKGDAWQVDDLVKGECVFAATGITDGSMLKGVRTSDLGRYVTHSVFMRSESGTVRWLTTEHGN